jgi:hypothetical protein
VDPGAGDILLFPWFISVISLWTVGVLLMYASLYRYERFVS